MNEALFRWFTNRGFNTGSLNDRIRAGLLATVAGVSASMSTNEMWKALGVANGYSVTDVQGIQAVWAQAQGILPAGSSWNDSMATLAP